MVERGKRNEGSKITEVFDNNELSKEREKGTMEIKSD